MNEKLAAVPAGSRGLLVLPYFAAAATPRYNPSARGTVLGLTFSHDRLALARAFMEGITLDMKDMVSSMVRSGVAVQEARILGGPTRSRVWNQIQADVYGVPGHHAEGHRCDGAGRRDPGRRRGRGLSDRGGRNGGDGAPGREVRSRPGKRRNVRGLYDAYCKAYDGLAGSGAFTALAGMQELPG